MLHAGCTSQCAFIDQVREYRFVEYILSQCARARAPSSQSPLVTFDSQFAMGFFFCSSFLHFSFPCDSIESGPSANVLEIWKQMSLNTLIMNGARVRVKSPNQNHGDHEHLPVILQDLSFDLRIHLFFHYKSKYVQTHFHFHYFM